MSADERVQHGGPSSDPDASLAGGVGPGRRSTGPSKLHAARSVDRALNLLSAVVARPGISLADAAHQTDVPSSSALRHLKVLEAHGLVKHGNGYHPGLGLVHIARRVIGASSLALLAEPELRRLAHETEESAYLAQRGGEGKALYVAQAESSRELRHVSWLGQQIPLADTAVGAALLGEVSRGEVCVRTGVVERDVRALASPVIDITGEVVACVALIGPSSRLRGARLTQAEEAVRHAAARLSGPAVAVESGTR